MWIRFIETHWRGFDLWKYRFLKFTVEEKHSLEKPKLISVTINNHVTNSLCVRWRARFVIIELWQIIWK